MKKKHMTNIRHILAVIEDSGYNVHSIRWVNDNRAIEVLIDWPQMTGQRAFLEKALEETNAADS